MTADADTRRIEGELADHIAAFEATLTRLMKSGLDAGLLGEARRLGVEVDGAIRRARAAGGSGLVVDLARTRLVRMCETQAGHLAALIADALPAPGDRRPEAEGTVLPAVELLVAMARLAPASHPLRGAIETVVAAILAAAKVFHDEFLRQIDGVDAIDMRQAGSDLLRLDILIWLLEILKADEPARCLRRQSQTVARGALRRARRVADAYLARRGPQQRFDLATVVAEVEELIVLVARIVEADSARAPDDLVDELGRRSVREFLHAMGKVALAAFRDLQERLEAGTLSQAVLEGSLKKVSNIRRFCHSARVSDADVVLAAVEQVIARKATALGVVLVRRRAEPGMTELMVILRRFLERVEAVRSRRR